MMDVLAFNILSRIWKNIDDMSMFIVQVHINMVKTLTQGFQYAPRGVEGVLGFWEREHRPSCLISTSGNYANMDLIRQAKVQSYPETNKQFCFCFLFYLDNVVDHCAWAVQYGI